MTRADTLLLGIVLVLAAVLVPATVGLAARQAGEIALTTPQGETTIDAAVDGRYSIEGHLGEVVVLARGGGVSIVESPCPEQRCVRMGPVIGAGDVIVCAPGGIAVRATDGPEVDDVVR